MLSINEQFADWLRPASLDLGAPQTALRQAAASEIAKDLSDGLLVDLVRLAYSRPINADERITDFRRKFKKHDENFQMSGNDAEILALCGCTLATALHLDVVTAAKVATVILAASAGNLRTPSLQFDLLGMAEDKLLKAARGWRERPADISIEIQAEEPAEEVSEEDEAPEQPPTLESLTEESKEMAEEFDGLQEQHAAMQRLLALQDEEIEILWWLVTGWSETTGKSFDEIPVDARSIFLSAELSMKCRQPMEMPGIRAILSRAGVNSSSSCTISSAINACGTDSIKRLQQPGKTCATITPIILGMERAIETGCNDDWIASWAGVTGIDSTKEVSSLEIATQFYRELIARKVLATHA
jgi:hypothetical protein